MHRYCQARYRGIGKKQGSCSFFLLCQLCNFYLRAIRARNHGRKSSKSEGGQGTKRGCQSNHLPGGTGLLCFLINARNWTMGSSQEHLLVTPRPAKGKTRKEMGRANACGVGRTGGVTATYLHVRLTVTHTGTKGLVPSETTAGTFDLPGLGRDPQPPSSPWDGSPKGILPDEAAVKVGGENWRLKVGGRREKRQQ